MKIFIYHLIFASLNLLFFFLFNKPSVHSWSFKFFALIWGIGLILVSLLLSFAINRSFPKVKLLINLLITYVLTLPLLSLFIVSLKNERTSFFLKLLAFYQNKATYGFLIYPYLLSTAIALSVVFVALKLRRHA